MKRVLFHGIGLVVILASSGCQKPGPVDLVDTEAPSSDLFVLQTTTLPDGAFGTEDIDSSRLFPPVQTRGFGQLLVGGSVFDGGTEHHEASLARAILFDRSAPVMINSDTVGYKTLNAGIVRIDDIPLFVGEKRLQAARLSLDTLLGVQYSLVSTDGLGGRGFQFVGSHVYQWKASGAGGISPFTVDFTSPVAIHVDSPTPDQTVSLSHNLRVRWSGGASSVDILVSELQSGVRARILIRLHLNSNRGGTVIPSTVLQILRNRQKALFTFTSGSTSLTAAGGYPDQIVVTASWTHNVVFSLSP
jgi:hypothetical protein